MSKENKEKTFIFDFTKPFVQNFENEPYITDGIPLTPRLVVFFQIIRNTINKKLDKTLEELLLLEEVSAQLISNPEKVELTLGHIEAIKKFVPSIDVIQHIQGQLIKFLEV
jgi:hypothetical protein